MKKSIKKTISFSVICLLSAAGFAGILLNASKDIIRVKAATTDDIELVDGVYQIKTAAGLVSFRDDIVNAGTYNANAILLNDIDLSVIGSRDNWTAPIGTPSNPYTGTFDGNNRIISNLNTTHYDGSIQPLSVTYNAFGFFGEVSGSVKNLNISDSDYRVNASGTTLYLGAIAGTLSGNGRIENCSVYATLVSNYKISSTTATGGIVGNIADYNSTVAKSSFSTDVSYWGDDYYGEQVSGYSLVGGIAGSSRGSITNCYSAGTVRGTVQDTPLSGQVLGGIVGSLSTGSITHSFNYSHFEGDVNVKKGGIVGSLGNSVTITDDYYAGTASYYAYDSTGQAIEDSDGDAKQLTDDEFKVKANFAEFSFGSVWSMGEYFPIIGINPITINLDNQSATTAGTTEIYENKGDGFYLYYYSESNMLILEMTSGDSADNPIMVPSKDGKMFAGYFTGTEGAGTKVIDKDGYIVEGFSPSTFDTETTLYAKWEEAVFDITYIYQDEDGNVIGPTSSDTATGPERKKYYYGQGDAYLEMDITKTGYTFVGYYLDEEMTNAISVLGSTQFTDDITLYVKWTANEYEITFDFDDGEGGTASIDATYGSAMPNITPPTKAGYTFVGYWRLPNAEGTKYYNSDGSSARTWDRPEATTLYAYWTPKEYTVILDGASSVDATYGQNLPNVSIPVDVGGREFDGYYDGQNGQGNRYIDETGAGCKAWDKDEDNVTLYPNFLASMTVESSGYEGVWLASPSDPSVGVGRTITVTPTDPEDAVVYYGTSAGNCNDTDISNYTYTEVGNYTVYFEVRKDGYTTYAGSETVIITKANSVVDPRPSAKTNLEYTNEDQALVNAGTVDYGTMLYAVNTTGNVPTSGEFSETIPTGKLVGDYYVFYSSSGDVNHEEYPISSENKVVTTINRVDRTDVTALNNEVLEFLVTLEGKSQYDTIASNLENVRSDVYSNAIVEDNVTSSEVLAKQNQLKEAYMNAKAAVAEYLINAIGEIVFPDSKDAIEEALEFFNSLSEEEKALVNSDLVETLTNDEETYEGTEEVYNFIQDIPEPSASDEYYDAIDEALAAYNNLSDTQKELLSDYKKKLDDNYSAREVIISIQNIGDIKYGGDDDSGPSIDMAATLYANLTDDQKELVNRANYEEYLHAKEVYENVDNVATIMKACPTPSESEEYSNGVDEAKEAYDSLTAEEKAVLNSSYNYEKVLNDNLAAREVINLIKINTSEINYQGGKGDSLLAIIEAKIAYDQLTDDQKALVDIANYEKLKDLISLYNRIDKVADLIKSIPSPDASSSYYDAVEIARNAFNSLSEDERAILLSSLDYDYEKALNDNLAAYEVIKLIDNIGEVTYNGGENDSLEDITAARNAYELLTDDQKALVERANYYVLVEAEASYKKVDDTIKLIQAIGDISYGGTSDSKEDLDKAREAYESLSEEEKGLVGEYNDSYQTLNDGEQVYEVLELIDEIGEVGSDSISEEKVKAAREAYESLSDEQKSKIGKEPLTKLEQSEKQIASLKRNNNAFIAIMIVISSLVLIGGGFLAFILIKRRKKASNEAN